MYHFAVTNSLWISIPIISLKARISSWSCGAKCIFAGHTYITHRVIYRVAPQLNKLKDLMVRHPGMNMDKKEEEDYAWSG